LAAACALLFVSAALTGGQQQREMPDARVEPMAGAVSVLFGQGGNIGLSHGPDGLLMIDTQYAPMAPKIEVALRALAGEGASARPVHVVNTHWHGDHSGGNASFRAGATLFAHENARRRLAGDAGLEGRVEARPDPAALPVVTYADGLSIHFNGEEVRLIHVPAAHTDGDTIVWFTKSKVAHLGDLFFEVGYPFVDLQSGGSVQGLIEGLRTVLELLPADVRLIPGHGRPTDVQGLEDYLAMIEQVTERVRAALAKGQSVEEMLAAGLTADFDERWGKFEFVPPQRFLTTIAESLQGE
jgi:glyoxylase-like metal-dependent hydrolase (beta-lactamase superfamily II)